MYLRSGAVYDEDDTRVNRGFDNLDGRQKDLNSSVYSRFHRVDILSSVGYTLRMSSITDTSFETIERFNMFGTNDLVLVAVSGGPDSVCLLDVLDGFRSRFGIKLRVVHVDHVTRDGDSADDARFVQTLADQHDMPCDVVRTDVELERLTRESFEEAARRIRYATFGATARRHGAARVATAHTADDQAETILMRMLRGTGPQGLAGIPPVADRDGFTVVRPFIDVWRRQIEQYIEELGIEVRFDRTNATECCLRNRIRLGLLPMLEREFNPAVKNALTRMAGLARDEQSFLADLTKDMAGPNVAEAAHGRVTVNRPAFRKLPITVARRAIMAWAATVMDKPWRGTTDAVEDGRKLIASESTTGETHLADGIRVRLEYNTAEIGLVEQIEPTGDTSISMTLPGTVDVPWADTGISVRTVRRDAVPGDMRQVCGPYIQYFDADKVSGYLVVRPRRQGDSFRPIGIGGTTKVSDFLINRKVPVRLRDSVPILCCDTGIIWVAGHGADERYAVDDHSTELIEVSVKPL